MSLPAPPPPPPPPPRSLDPDTRRGVHRILAGLRGAGRAVLLTTHSMAEADLLSSRICILAHGRVRAIGTPPALKAEWGSGYRLS